MQSPGDVTLCLPRTVIFGWGRFAEAPAEVQALGKRVLLVAGRTGFRGSEAHARFETDLRAAGVEVAAVPGPAGEPEVDDVDALCAEARPWSPDVVVGCGGGSTLDLAKAVAALIPDGSGGRCADFLEGTGATRPLVAPPLPLVAVPTTAGTGSEATRNAVISWPAMSLKRSLRDPRMTAAAAIVDPELTVSAPAAVTASSGMDALTQLVESFLSRHACAFTDALCLETIPRVAAALPRACACAGDRDARASLAYGALASGVCLAAVGLGVAHAVAPALGILHGVPHGTACAALLPFALEVNAEAARDKLAAVWRAIDPSSGGDAAQAVARLIAHVRGLCAALGIPTQLRAFGVTEADLPALGRLAGTGGLRTNARRLAAPELPGLLAAYL